MNLTRQSGVTLAILLWFLAALAVLAAGITYQARVDVKLAQLHREIAAARAAADGAIQLAMADLQSRQLGDLQGGKIFRGEYRLGEMQVSVSLYPASGLISINMADEGLLSLLFRSAGLPPARAQQLATNVVEWRTPRTMANRAKQGGLWPAGYVPRNARYEAPEDLLLVYGMNREIYEKIKDSIYVGQMEQPGVDWESAPHSVLQALAGGDADVARSIARTREQEQLPGALPPGEIDSSYQGSGFVPLVRADAIVSAAGKRQLRRRWADSSRNGADGLPWHYVRTEPVRAVRG